MWDNHILLNRFSSVLLYLAVLAALSGVGHYLVNLPTLFPLRSVRLDAAPHRVDASQILALLSSEVRGNFFTVDIAHLRQSLEKLQWVRSVHIRREFPAQLVLNLEEHQALAVWNDSQLVNLQGEVFNGNSEQLLPHFIGQASDAMELTQRYAQFAQQLGVLQLRVMQLALSPRHAWQLRLSNGMVVELGREELQERLARFVAAYPIQRTEGQKSESVIAHVDMRYRNGFAVGG